MEGLTVCSEISQRAVIHGFKGQQETQHTLALCTQIHQIIHYAFIITDSQPRVLKTRSLAKRLQWPHSSCTRSQY